jgi:hypothetical protein
VNRNVRRAAPDRVNRQRSAGAHMPLPRPGAIDKPEDQGLNARRTQKTAV